MTGDLLTLSTREMDTLAIITRLAERRMTQSEAARCLGRSERQVRRLLRAFERDGVAGLRDKRRGRPAPNRIPKAYQEYILGLVRERYRDFDPTFASEKLEEYHDIRVATETLRQWMIDDGIWLTRRQRNKRVQQPRHRGRRALTLAPCRPSVAPEWPQLALRPRGPIRTWRSL
jgi:transposase